MPYYTQEDYVSVKDMRGWNKDDKAEQINLNWWIRVEYYALNNKTASFVKMVEKWFNDHDGSVPSQQVMRLGDMATFLEERLTAQMRPNQPQAEIENRRPIFHSTIIDRIVAENNRLKAKYGW